MKENPFPKLTAEARRHLDNKRLLDELGAYLSSLAIKPRRERYDFGSDEEEGESVDLSSDVLSSPNG